MGASGVWAQWCARTPVLPIRPDTSAGAVAPETRGVWRWLRGILVAAVATGLALGAHTAAGGHAPSWFPVAAIALVVGLVSVGVSRFRWTGPRLLAVLACTQLGLHPLFNAQPGTPAGHVHTHATAAVDATSVVSSGWSMWISHMLAAIATAVLLRCGEHWLAGVLDALALRALRIVDAAGQRWAIADAGAIQVRVAALPRYRVAASAWSQRGPPR
ncbi:MAG: hypothetical protein ACRDUV_23275 [Pseudonocardiaceae bacterium]